MVAGRKRARGHRWPRPIGGHAYHGRSLGAEGLRVRERAGALDGRERSVCGDLDRPPSPARAHPPIWRGCRDLECRGLWRAASTTPCLRDRRAWRAGPRDSSSLRRDCASSAFCRPVARHSRAIRPVEDAGRCVARLGTRGRRLAQVGLTRRRRRESAGATVAFGSGTSTVTIGLTWAYRGRTAGWDHDHWVVLDHPVGNLAPGTVRPLLRVDGTEATGERDPWYVVGDPMDTLVALKRTHQSVVQLIYIDAPRVETNATAFPAGDASAVINTWLTVMHALIRACVPLLAKDGVIAVLCGARELPFVQLLLSELGTDKYIVTN